MPNNKTIGIVILSGWIVGALCSYSYKTRKAETGRKAYETCIDYNAAIREARLELLQYQTDNRFIINEDAGLSFSYIDFLKEKADNECNENRQGKS